MPLNIPGLLVPFQLIFNPRIVLPAIVVKGTVFIHRVPVTTSSPQQDIRYLDFAALRKAGYRGAVFDKDNCITRPHKDTIVPEIRQAWDECREVFGEGNVLIVSNSSGTSLDPSGIQCEAVTHNTLVPVLRHRSFKPAYSCITSLRAYFSSLRIPIPDDELIIVGDRVFTDLVMANRMRRNGYSQEANLDRNRESTEKDGDVVQDRPRGPLAVWTTGIWEKEALMMRWFEKQLVDLIHHWFGPAHPASARLGRFIKKFEPEIQLSRNSGVMEWLARIRRRT